MVDEKATCRILALKKDGLTYSQIAAKLKITKGVVSGVCYRAKFDKGESQWTEAARAIIVEAASRRSLETVAAEWSISPATIRLWQRQFIVQEMKT